MKHPKDEINTSLAPMIEAYGVTDKCSLVLPPSTALPLSLRGRDWQLSDGCKAGSEMQGNAKFSLIWNGAYGRFLRQTENQSSSTSCQKAFQTCCACGPITKAACARLRKLVILRETMWRAFANAAACTLPFRHVRLCAGFASAHLPRQPVCPLERS